MDRRGEGRGELVRMLLFACVFCSALPLQAQTRVDTWTPPLPSAKDRKVADVASWATVVSVVALDTMASFDSVDRRRAFVLQGARVGVTYGVVYLVKRLANRDRPCLRLRLECDNDSPQSSFYSAHTALAFSTIGGPRLAFVLPLAISTGGLRVAAGKHWLTDVLVGAGAGVLTSRLR